MLDVSWNCPQCNAENTSHPELADRFHQSCDDCGAEVCVDVEIECYVNGVDLIERGTNHDEPEEELEEDNEDEQMSFEPEKAT